MDDLLDPGNLTPAEFIEAAQNVRKTFYWEQKDLSTYVVLTKHLFRTAIENHDAGGEYADDFGNRILGLGYDLASMTWPGWDEDGIDMTEEFRKTGLVAAKLIVDFADAHDAPAAVRYNNYWLYGAHLLADGNTDAAREAWGSALALASQDERPGMEAWLAVADSVESGETTLLEDRLRQLEAADEPQAGTASQIRTAMNVFLKSG